MASKRSKIINVQFLFALLFALCNNTVAQSCTFQLPKAQNDDPVYFDLDPIAKKLSLVKPAPAFDFKGNPVVGKISVNNGKQLVVACPKNGNTFKNSVTSYSTVACDTKNIAAFRSSLGQSKCHNSQMAEVVNTNKLCPHGKIHEVGYKVANYPFVAQYSVCYDENNQIPRYTRHTINGKQLPHKQNASPGRTYWEDCMTGDSYNDKINGIQILNKLLGPQQKYSVYGPSGTVHSIKNYIAFGHFAPMADFALGYEQTATNFRINGAPQFQDMNNGNWKRLEERVRRLAEGLTGGLEVFTGQIGSLELRHSINTNEYKEIEFDMPTYCTPYMPAAFFKAIRNENNEGIVFITMQDIRADDNAKNKFVDSTCATRNLADCPSGWGSSEFVKISKGYTVCCKFNDFVSHYKYDILPQSIVNANTRLWQFNV